MRLYCSSTSNVKAQETVEYYRDNLRRFLWYLDNYGGPKEISEVDEGHIQKFLGYVASEPKRWGLTGAGSETASKKASTSTVRHYFVVLHCFFNWATRKQHIKINPVAALNIKKPKPKLINPYTKDEIKKMLTLCDNDVKHNAKFLGTRNKALIFFLLDTGARLSELTGIRCIDLDLSNGTCVVNGKGEKQRKVGLSKGTRKMLLDYMLYRQTDHTDRLWVTEEGKTLNNSGVQSLMQRMKQRAAITGNGSIHRWRHTFAITALRNGMDPFHLQLLLGHNTLEMVRKYTAALAIDDALKAHQKASPVDSMGFR